VSQIKIGEPVRQLEAPRFLTGKGRFADDINLHRQGYVAFVRSPHAHADIVAIDTAAARDMPGIAAILTGADYAAEGLGILESVTPGRRRDKSAMFRPARPAITHDRVRHVGQIVALVIGETLNEAKDAAELIRIKYQSLPAHIDTQTGNAADTPALWADCPDNESSYSEMGDAAATAEAIATAEHVVRERFIINRLASNPMEPRAVVVDYDPGRDKTTIHACNQRPYVWRNLLATHLFHIPENQIAVITGDVGGSFGMKSGLYPEMALSAWASRRLQRPIKWTCERSEGHLADDQARDMVMDVELGLSRDGIFKGIRLSATANTGAFLAMRAYVTPPGVAGSLCGPYSVKALHGQAVSVFTNTVPVSSYRGPARAPVTYVLERIIDIAARDLKIDPAEIRRRNLIAAEAMPYTTPLNAVYDCGEFEAVLDKCLAKADYASVATRKTEAAKRGKLYGVGVCTAVDTSAPPTPETAEVRFDPQGTATILVGSTAQGQSHETIYAQLLSQTLGLDSAQIRVVEGDTDRLAWGEGTGASRTATIAGSAVAKAIEKIVLKGKRIAAHILEAAETDIDFKDGRYAIAGTDRSLSFKDIAKAAFAPAKLPKDIEPGLFETASWSPDVYNFANGCHICEIEIDPETGRVEIVRYSAVDDVGIELNPLLVKGQIHGGIAQGAGQALMEDMVYDPKTGQILSGSFMDYAMPRASDFCFFDLGSHPVPTQTNPLGVKGAGESGTVGALAAVMNAVHDALAPLGVRNIAMPLTAEKVWRAIQEARSAA
jgi:carbon-monoxide dehydrogenase large subunit